MSGGSEHIGPDIAHVREAMRVHDRDNPPVHEHRDEQSRRELTEEEGSDGGDLLQPFEPPPGDE